MIPARLIRVLDAIILKKVYQMTQHPSVILDADYSHAFLGAALESGKAKIDDRTLQKLHIKGDPSRFLVGYRATNRLKARALEMALIFDKVHLFDIPPAIEIEMLKREEIIGMIWGPGYESSLAGYSIVPAKFVPLAKSWMVRSALRRVNILLKSLGYQPVSYSAMSLSFDAVEFACHAEADLEKLKQTILQLIRDRPKKRKLDSEYIRLVVGIDAILSGIDDIHPMCALFSILAAITETLYIWTLGLCSNAFSIPFLSNGIRTNSLINLKTNLKVHDSFSLCQIAMNEELNYAPSVNTIDDVLRLRDHKSITRFRELLFEWCQQLPAGNIQVLNKIKRDIGKANRELRHLEKWKTVDRWLFWVQLPTTLIPILSTIVTIASFTTHLWIERKEPVNSWVGIGR